MGFLQHLAAISRLKKNNGELYCQQLNVVFVDIIWYDENIDKCRFVRALWYYLLSSPVRWTSWKQHKSKNEAKWNRASHTWGAKICFSLFSCKFWPLTWKSLNETFSPIQEQRQLTYVSIYGRRLVRISHSISVQHCWRANHAQTRENWCNCNNASTPLSSPRDPFQELFI